SVSLTASEVSYLPANRPAGTWKLILAREVEHEYEVDHRGDLFYIRTNQGARNFRLVSAPVTNPGKANWKEVIPHRPSVMLEGMGFFAHHYVVMEREAGLPQLRVTDLRTGNAHRIKLPEPVYSIFPSTNPEFDTTVFRYNYQSFVRPSSVFDYDMAAQTSK